MGPFFVVISHGDFGAREELYRVEDIATLEEANAIAIRLSKEAAAQHPGVRIFDEIGEKFRVTTAQGG